MIDDIFQSGYWHERYGLVIDNYSAPELQIPYHGSIRWEQGWADLVGYSYSNKGKQWKPLYSEGNEIKFIIVYFVAEGMVCRHVLLLLNSWKMLTPPYFTLHYVYSHQLYPQGVPQHLLWVTQVVIGKKTFFGALNNSYSVFHSFSRYPFLITFSQRIANFWQEL